MNLDILLLGYRQLQPHYQPPEPAAAAADAPFAPQQVPPAAAAAAYQAPPAAQPVAPPAVDAAQAYVPYEVAVPAPPPPPVAAPQAPPRPIFTGISPATYGVNVWCPMPHVQYSEIPHIYQPLPPWGQYRYMESLIMYMAVNEDEFWTIIVPGYDFSRAYRAPQHTVALPPNGTQIIRLDPFGIWFQIFRAERGCNVADCHCRLGAPNFRQFY